MRDLKPMSERCRLVAAMRGGQWTAHAVRADTGERFGIEVTAGTEEEATARLARWLEWQQEHAAALEALQQAERAYHRGVAGHAFVGADAAAAGGEARAVLLREVDATRARLDRVRAQRPM